MTDVRTDAPAAERLAAYAVGVEAADLPADAIDAARRCLIDAVACIVHGAGLPWSRMVIDHARTSAAPGPCRLPGVLDDGLSPAAAALVYGACAHAFELDSLRKPGAGVHPGATVAGPALAVADLVGAGDADLLAAIVAGCEVMFRIGMATKHTPEDVGFHAPGLTGPFGAAAAAGRLLRLSASQMANAFGLAGSMAGGLLAFAKAPSGGMVKRLHLGRAAEAGVTAALLASRGFEGPRTVLDGRFGLLEAFCRDTDPGALTHGLGERYEILSLCIKRYACHVTAQAPIQLLGGIMAREGVAADAVADLTLAVPPKVLSHHAGRSPADVMQAQYSVPFAVAVAAHRDVEDPGAFSADVLADPRIGALARRIALEPGPAKGWGVELRLTTVDGRRFEDRADGFLGCPETPMPMDRLAAKFARLTGHLDRDARDRLAARFL